MSLERHWQRVTPLSAALYPLSLVFRAVAALRRAAYVRGLLRAQRVRVPVIVVGNIYVGGTGKTPLVLWLARFLRERGRRPGIVSRGYGGSAAHPSEVRGDTDPALSGDEPLLLARRSGCPVWTGRDRVAAARALLAAHPECDVVISDDGLQHYRLARDVEIVVVDGARGLGNRLLLPAGPLREPASRLDTADAVVVNGESMKLAGSRFRNLRDGREAQPGFFQGKRVVAIAGIGHPPRFFAHLERLGLQFEAHAFPDHHAYSAGDIAFPDADAVVMTEKDAVKCARFASDKHWMLPVDAELDARLGELVLSKITNASKP